MDALLAVFGRAHPMVLHLPIGLVLALLALDLLERARGRELVREVALPLATLAALSGLVAAASGWTLAEEPGYGGETLYWHRWLGAAVAVSAVATAVALRAAWSGLYRGSLFLCAILLVLAGHRGATLTHGAGFLTEPLREREPAREVEPSAEPDVGPTWSRDVAPILRASCWNCHGADKTKGGLALHTPDAVRAGGENGAVVAAGAPDASPLLQRALLPIDDMDHMPPEGKPQPSAAELEVLRAWIAAGATFDVEGAVAPPPQPRAAPAEDEESAALPAPDAAALAALESEFVHVEATPAGSDDLWVDFAAVAERADDATVRRLLEPLRAHVVEVSLARSPAGDGSAALLAGFPRLRRLDLRASDVSDAGIAALAEHPTLAELVLAQTAVGDGAIDALVAMPALARLWLWKSAVSADGLARLRAARPGVVVDDGAAPDAAVLEAEGELVFSSDRPLPGAEALRASGLAPVNARCPVSGSPVNPAHTLVHDGRVIGFCCPDCPAQFREDPESFLDTLE